EKQIGNPGSDAALELPPKRRGVGHQFRGAGRPARGFEQVDSFAGENVLASAGDAVDRRAIVLVREQRNALLILTDGTNRRKTVAAAELGGRVVPQQVPKHPRLFLA